MRRQEGDLDSHLMLVLQHHSLFFILLTWLALKQEGI